MKKAAKRSTAFEVALRLPKPKDMQALYRSLDWRELWEEFYLSLLPNGQLRHKTVFAFIRSRTPKLWKNDHERDFLYYLLGPPEPLNPPDAFTFVKPFDWQAKRDTGGWANQKTSRQLEKVIAGKWDRLEALRELGNTHVLSELSSIREIIAAIDTAFAYGRIPDGLSAQETSDYIGNYLRHREKAQYMQAAAIDTLAKTYGINFDETEGLTQILLNTINVKQVGASADGKDKVALDLSRMLLGKSLKYGTPLPAGTDKIIEGHLAPEDPKEEKPN